MSIAMTAGLLNNQIDGCHAVPIIVNADERGCLSEIVRTSWSGAFPAVQWNARASSAGVVRGAHVHADYDEYYTLLQGRVVVGLADIRRDSATFGRSVQFNWSDRDCVAIVVPVGIAHVVYFQTDAMLVFGLCAFWTEQSDNIGCQWNARSWRSIGVPRTCGVQSGIREQEVTR
jgi:dTDP-4-dehydrorhamnose 3,5-epimerase